MRKPAKAAKAAKLRVPDDQVPLKTECGHCGQVFPNPTLACWHVGEEHPDGQ